MKTKAESKNESRMQFKRLLIVRNALVAFLAASVGFTAIAQSFYNLDFESASVTPPGPGSVPFSSALPGWTGYCGTNVQTYVNYNQEWLDTAGTSLFDGNCTVEPVQGLIDDRFCVCLYSGLKPIVYTFDVPTSIAQTGWIPSGTKSILFNFRQTTG
jgi:hypothetical protein